MLPTKPEESEPHSKAQLDKRTLWTKLARAVMLKKQRSEPSNTIVAGTIMRFSPSASLEILRDEQRYFAEELLNERIRRGWINLTPTGTMYYLPGTQRKPAAILFPFNPSHTFRLLAVSDSSAAHLTMTQPGDVWLELHPPEDGQPIHYVHSASANLFILINSAELTASTKLARSSSPHDVSEMTGATEVFRQKADSSQVLLRHEGLTERDYEIIDEQLTSTRAPDALLCEWLYLENIIDYNKICSFTSWATTGIMARQVSIKFTKFGVHVTTGSLK